VARAIKDMAIRGAPAIGVAAAYGLGVLGSPAMGPMAPNAVESVISNVVGALQHPDAATRQVVARIVGRVFAPAPGASFERTSRTSVSV
jgi:methylthioribose-1-phosphate isomerase